MTKRTSSIAAALAVAALSVELSANSAPTEIRLLPAGEFRAGDGSGRPAECKSWVMLPEDGARIVAAAAALGKDLVLDYEHATLHAKEKGSKAPAAGWMKNLTWRPDGLYATVDWTACAAQEIANKEYRYISPVFSYDKVTGRVETFFHASLTNDPALGGLTDLAALAAEIFLPSHNSQETPVNELLKKLLAALGLQETATEAEALSAIGAMKSNVAALTAQVATPDPAKFAPVAALTALQGEKAELQTQLAALQAQVDGGKLETLMAKGIDAGKIPPSMETWARELGKKDIAALSSYIDNAPAVAKPGETQTGGKGADGTGSATAALSAEQQTVIAALGLSVEQFNKARQEV